jgi:hypothetical protein
MLHATNENLKYFYQVLMFYVVEKFWAKNCLLLYLKRSEHICFLFLSLYFPFYSPLLPSSLLFFLFSFVYRCSLIRSAILVSPLCVRSSTFVLCHSSPPWPLLLFASYVFVLNKSFLLYRSAFMYDIWDKY